MAINLQVIHAREFVRLDADEHLDFEATRLTLQALARACWKRGVDSALLDLRGLPRLERPHFNPTQLAALVGTFREAGFTRQQRLAILYRHDIHGGIRNFAFISRMRGMQVQAFSDYETAMQWLSESPQSQAEQAGSGVAIPITKPAAKAKKLSVSLPSPGTHARAHRPVRHSRS